MVHFHDLKIMLVEDNQALQESIIDLLMVRGFHNIAAFKDAFNAVHFCKKLPPDLAVLDVEMPGLSGLDLLIELKHIKPTLPVIMMSSSHKKSLLMKACESGAETFFPKPLDTEMFCRKIEELLKDISFLD